MHIRQLSLHYRPEADRLLLRVNVSDGAQMAVWFTRRLCLRLWPHLQRAVTRLAVAEEAGRAQLQHAIVTPDAQAMLAQSARERVLRAADFKTPFVEQAQSHPLGAEPMVAVEVQLTALAAGHLRLLLVDADKRQLQLQLTETMATAFKELMVQALRQAEWGLELADAAAPSPSPAPGSHRLN